MSSVRTLQGRVQSLQRRMKGIPPKAWSFVLLDDQEIPPEKLAIMRPQDPVYIKRIVLEG